MTAHYPDGAAHDARAPWNDDEGDDLDGLNEFEPDPDAEFERMREERYGL